MCFMSKIKSIQLTDRKTNKAVQKSDKNSEMIREITYGQSKCFEHLIRRNKFSKGKNIWQKRHRKTVI